MFKVVTSHYRRVENLEDVQYMSQNALALPEQAEDIFSLQAVLCVRLVYRKFPEEEEICGQRLECCCKHLGSQIKDHLSRGICVDLPALPSKLHLSSSKDEGTFAQGK